jgi:hypothetical protein
VNRCAQCLHHRGQHCDGGPFVAAGIGRRRGVRDGRLRRGVARAEPQHDIGDGRNVIGFRGLFRRGRTAGDLDHRIDAMLEFIQHRRGILGIGYGLGPCDRLRHFAKRRPQARHRGPFVADQRFDPAECCQDKRCIGADVGRLA